MKNPDETVIIYRDLSDRKYIPFPELEIEVNCWVDPGQDGGRWDPPFAPSIDDYEPWKIRAIDYPTTGLWHNYDKFCERYGIELEFDEDELLEHCQDNAERRAKP